MIGASIEVIYRNVLFWLKTQKSFFLFLLKTQTSSYLNHTRNSEKNLDLKIKILSKVIYYNIFSESFGFNF